MGWIDRLFGARSAPCAPETSGVIRESDAIPLGTIEIHRPENGAGEGRMGCALGIETFGGVFTPFITENTPVPAANTQTFSTAAPDQDKIDIHLLKRMPDNARGPVDVFSAMQQVFASHHPTFEKVLLCDIPPAPPGGQALLVTLYVDHEGNCWLWARDKATGKRATVLAAGDINSHYSAVGRERGAFRIGTIPTLRTDEYPSEKTLLYSIAREKRSGDFQKPFARTVGLPAIASDFFRCAGDRMDSIALSFRLLDKSERSSDRDNTVLGEVRVQTPAGATTIKTTYFVDNDGTLWVWAENCDTGTTVPVGKAM